MPAEISADRDRAETVAQLEAAQRGDESVLPAVRALMQSTPDMAEALGNLASRAEKAWVKRVSGPHLLLSEAMTQKLAVMKATLLGPLPSELERLIVERVAICWLQVNYFDAKAAQPGDGQTFRQAEFALKQGEQSQRRYLRALKTLAEVRRLGVPIVQLNVAKQQVNVASADMAARCAQLKAR